MFAASVGAQAQTATIYGSLGNFDVVNNTGQNACGFEVDWKASPDQQFHRPSPVQRYGVPTITAYTVGAVSGTACAGKAAIAA